ncbi:extensin-like [Amphibalanus amphitrite]|nr:extensin-like [Amphibalanus amphitrite]XP_043239009.1 extensin-like [Amphibalanus amphitrite]
MLSWLAGRRSPSGVHLLTDDPLAVIAGPVDKQQTVYAVSRTNPMFEEAWPGGVRPAEDERTGWQRSAADGSTYWHEPPPDSSLQLEAAADDTGGPPDSLEPPPPASLRRFTEHGELPEVHRGPRIHRGPLRPGAPAGRPATLPRPVWPSAVGDAPVPEPPRRLSVTGYMTVADHVGPTWPGRRAPPPGAVGRFPLDRRATFPPARAGLPGRLPSIPDEEVEPPTDGQPDSIVTESLLRLTTPRTTPAGSVRDGTSDSRSPAGSTRAESFRWEGSPAGGAAGADVMLPPPPPPLPPLAPPPGSFNWDRTLEPLLQVLWSGDESPPVLRRFQEVPSSVGGPGDLEAALPWRNSAAGEGPFPAPPSRASSELSQLYAELAAPRPFSRALSEELYAWPVSPPVAVAPPPLARPPTRAESPPPAYLNQLLPSDTSSAGGRRRGRLGSDASSQPSRSVRRTPSDACSDDSRDSRLSAGSRGRLLPSDSSEGGSERRVTFSADTVDNEPGPARPRPRRHADRPPARRAVGRGRNKGFYASNMLSRLTGLSHSAGGKKELQLRGVSVELGRKAELRSRHLCTAVTAVLVLVLLAAAGVLTAWLWTTERRLFRV